MQIQFKMLSAKCILNIFCKMQPQCVNDRFSYSRYIFVCIFYSSGHITGKCNDYYIAMFFPKTAVIHSIIVNDVTPNWQVLETRWKAVAFEKNISWETTKEQQKITLNYIGLGPISRTIFPSWFKFDGNFILLSSKLYWSGCYEILNMAQQMCCRGMCKIL